MCWVRRLLLESTGMDMKFFLSLVTIICCSVFTNAQNIRFVGSVYDPNGAIVIGARIEARSETSKVLHTVSNNDGKFELELPTGLYALIVSATGFLTIKYNEYLVVNTFDRKMTMDFVMFGSLWHEPCGVSGGDCLPEELLIKDYKVEYSPKLKDIKKRFGGESDKKSSKR